MGDRVELTMWWESLASLPGRLTQSAGFRSCSHRPLLLQEVTDCVGQARGCAFWEPPVMSSLSLQELSKITMPIAFNEPLSFLQRITEYMEHIYLVHRASRQPKALERMQVGGPCAGGARPRQ